jgi:hypothetical protein
LTQVTITAQSPSSPLLSLVASALTPPHAAGVLGLYRARSVANAARHHHHTLADVTIITSLTLAIELLDASFVLVAPAARDDDGDGDDDDYPDELVHMQQPPLGEAAVSTAPAASSSSPPPHTNNLQRFDYSNFDLFEGEIQF